jgi:SAM-dependent methyltransferase
MKDVSASSTSDAATELLPMTVLLGEATARRFGIRFVPSDIEREDLPFEDESFDVVVMTEIIEHFHFQPVATLARALRVLRTGGLLLVTTPALGFGWEPEFHAGPFEEIPPFDPAVPIDPSKHMKIYSQAELDRLIRHFSEDVHVGLHINELSRKGYWFAIARKK